MSPDRAADPLVLPQQFSTKHRAHPQRTITQVRHRETAPNNDELPARSPLEPPTGSFVTSGPLVS